MIRSRRCTIGVADLSEVAAVAATFSVGSSLGVSLLRVWLVQSAVRLRLFRFFAVLVTPGPTDPFRSTMFLRHVPASYQFVMRRREVQMQSDGRRFMAEAAFATAIPACL